MKLTNYGCRSFALRFETGPDNFDQGRFFSDTRLSDFKSKWVEGEPLELTYFTGRTKSSDYHAHIRLQLRKKTVRAEVLWFAGTLKKERGSRYPFAEDVLTWVSKFYSKTSYNVRVTVNYSFARSVSAPVPFIGIPFGIPFVPGYTRGEPIKLVGVTVSTDLPGATWARIHAEIMDDRSLWVMIHASYKRGLSRLGPDRLLSEFSEILARRLLLSKDIR